MDKSTAMVPDKNRRFIKPGIGEELAEIIGQRKEQKIKSEIEKRVTVAKTVVGQYFRYYCNALFNLTEEDIRNLPDTHIIELEKEIVRRNKKDRFRRLVYAAPLTLLGGGGVASMIFGSLIPTGPLFPEYIGDPIFVGGMLLLLGTLAAAIGLVGTVCLLSKKESCATAHKSLKEKIKALYPSASEREAEEKFSAELLDAIRQS